MYEQNTGQDTTKRTKIGEFALVIGSLFYFIGLIFLHAFHGLFMYIYFDFLHSSMIIVIHT